MKTLGSSDTRKSSLFFERNSAAVCSPIRTIGGSSASQTGLAVGIRVGSSDPPMIVSPTNLRTLCFIRNILQCGNIESVLAFAPLRRLFNQVILRSDETSRRTYARVFANRRVPMSQRLCTRRTQFKQNCPTHPQALTTPSDVDRHRRCGREAKMRGSRFQARSSMCFEDCISTIEADIRSSQREKSR